MARMNAPAVGQLCTLVLHLLLGAEAKPVIRIAHLYQSNEPFTAVRYMMEQFVNATNRTLLPDHDVVVDPIPFEVASGDASIKFVEALTAEQPYHAISGPWSNLDCLDAVQLGPAGRVLHIMKGENVEFTYETEKYPYVFRTLRSMDGIIHSWVYMLASNAWPTALSVLTESTTIDGTNFWFNRYNLTNLAILANIGQDAVREAWYSTAVSIIRTTRVRVAITYFNVETEFAQLTCYVHLEGVRGMQYFAPGYYPPGWTLVEVDDVCTSDILYDAVYGYIATVHTFIAPGVVALDFNLPILEGVTDHSRDYLTCMPDMTVQDYFSANELLVRGIQEGFITGEGSAQRFLGTSGSELDMVCALMSTLHDVIYNKGIPEAFIESRHPLVYEELIESMRNVDFVGPTGPFRFYPNSGDAEILYYLLTQPVVRGQDFTTAVMTATATYPNGPFESPVITPLAREFEWRDNSTGLGPKPHLAFFPRCGDINAELVGESCVKCKPGRYYDVLVDHCRTCAEGDYQTEEGMSECITALPGMYVSDTDRPVNASPCTLGHECPLIGTTSPWQCSPGRYAAVEGLPSCSFCRAGTYEDEKGSTGCKSCEAVVNGSTTASVASTSDLACICRTGTFRPVGQSVCLSCLQGMACPEASDMLNLMEGNSGPYPQVNKGYMTVATEPLTVYRCKLEEHCPGGAPGSCASYRDASTVACGDCMDDAYENGDKCEACGEATLLPMLLAVFFGAVAVVVATILINKDVHKTPASSFLIVSIAGLLFASLQAMGVYHQMAIPWNEPVKTLLRLSQVLSFDVGWLKVACVFGVNPVRTYGVRQVVPLLAVPFMLGALLIKKFTARGQNRRKPEIRIDLLNAIGTLYSLFFISIVISALTPFLCYKHPGNSGESVISAPALLCFDSDEHSAMVAIGVVAMSLLPIPFLVLCIFGIRMYPRYIVSHRSQSFLHAFRFLFFRYQPSRYYFHLLVLFRSLLLCLIPAIFRGQPSTQVLFMVLLLGSYIISEAYLQPWRSWFCNGLDAGMNIALVEMLICGALFLEDTPQKDAVSVLATTVIISIAALAISGVCIAVKRRISPSPFYDFFLCHHKAHAAAQARYLKLLLVAKGNVQVFIDSDDLKQLDTLFDVVKSRVRHLVVYLTADTLRRPWCAGEVVSAMRAEIRITRFMTPSFAALSEEQLSNPETYIDTVGCNLSEYNIQWHHISAAFRAFFTEGHVKQMDLSHDVLGTHRLTHAAAMLLKHRIQNEPHRPLREHQGAEVMVASDADNDEANSSVGILLHRIAKDLFQVSEQGVCVTCDCTYDSSVATQITQQARAVVVILSSGCLDTPVIFSTICAIQLMQGLGSAPGLISINTPGFVFPSAKAIDAACRGNSAGFEPDTAATLLKSFFKNICVLLPTHASQEAIDIQSDEVFTRINACLRTGGGNASSTGTGGLQQTGSKSNSARSASVGSAVASESGTPKAAKEESAAVTSRWAEDV